MDRTKEASMEFKKCTCFSSVQNGPVLLNCTCDAMARVYEERKHREEEEEGRKMEFSSGFGVNYDGFYRAICEESQ